MAAAGEARYSTAPATSATLATRPTGILDTTSDRNSGRSSRSDVPGVRTKVGATLFTVTPNGAHSRARTLVSAITAPLLALYAAWRRIPTSPAWDAMFTMRPWRWATIRRAADWQAKN